MAETSIEFIREDEYAYWFSSDRKYMNKIYKMAQDYPNEVKIITDERDKEEGGIEIRIPSNWFKMPKAPSKKNLTREQREAAAIRMKNARSKKND